MKSTERCSNSWCAVQPLIYTHVNVALLITIFSTMLKLILNISANS